MHLLLLLSVATLKLQTEAQERARVELAELFRAVCPEQCLVLAVNAQVGEETLGDATPGFDAPGAQSVPVLRGVQASVLVDSHLPPPFRARMKPLAIERLKALGVPVQVNVETVAFPVRNPPYLEAQPPAPQPAAPAPAQQPQVAAATPVPPATPADTLREHFPLLAAAGLLSFSLLLLGALLFLALRRSSEPVEYVDEAPAPQPAAAAPPGETFSEARARKLEKALGAERALRNAILREALQRGEHALVARWVRELGDFLLDDLRGDAHVAEGLAALSTALVRGGPPERREALQELEGRLLSRRLSRAQESADDHFAFLEGVQPGAFAAACAALPLEVSSVVLRFAPSHLRAVALNELPAALRQELALLWSREREVSAAAAQAAADELRERLASSTGAERSTQALRELLESLPRAEQDALLGRVGAVRGFTPESSLLSAPDDVVAAAALGAGTPRLLDYLRGADGALRERVLSACPPRLSRELREELSLRAGGGDFALGRRALLTSLAQELAARTPARPRLVVD